jgi:hypothetical protein
MRSVRFNASLAAIAEHAPEPWPIGHVHHVELRHGEHELPPVGADAAQQVGVKAGHHVGAAFGGQANSEFAAFLEVVAVFDQRHAQRAHGGVFLQRVAVRNHDGAGHAVGARGPAYALAVVAACGADDVRGQFAAPLQRFEISEPTAQLEGADRRVVFVLDPAVGAQALAGQTPAVLRRCLEFAVDHAGGVFDLT